MPPESDFQKEIDQLEQRFAENPQGLVFAHLADAYRKAGEYAKAEGLILHGLKNHPNYISAYNVLGRVYLDSERYSDAHEQFSRVIQLDPHNLIALKALGDLAAGGGRSEDARGWYERILQVDPRNDLVREELRRLDAAGGDLPPAEAFQHAAAQAGTPEWDEEEAPVLDETGPPWDFEDMMLAETESDAGERLAEPSKESEAEQPGGEVQEVVAEQPDASDMLPWDAMSDLEELEARGQQTTDAIEELADKSELVEPTVGAQPLTDQSADDTWNLDFGALDEWAPSFLDGDEVGDGEAAATAEPASEEAITLPPFSEPPVVQMGREKKAGEGVVTETMARLYADQGLYEDALAVYRRLSELRPDDEGIQARIAEIEARLAATAEAAAPESESTEADLADLLELTEPLEADTAMSSVVAAPAEEEGFEFEDEAPVAGFDLLDPFAASFDVLIKRDVVAGPPGMAGVSEQAEPESEAPAELNEEIGREATAEEFDVPLVEEFAAFEAGKDLDTDVLGIAALEPEADLVPEAEEAAEPATEVPWDLGPLSDDYEAEAEEPAAVEEVVEQTEGLGHLADTLVTSPISDAAEAMYARPEAEESGAPTAGALSVEDYLSSLLAFHPGAGERRRDAPAEEAGPVDEGNPDEARDLEEFQAWLRGLKR